MIVIDASVAAKWYLHETGSDDAANLLSSAPIMVAPALIRIEVTGAIIRRYREGKISRQRAQEACDLWDGDLAHGVVRLIADDMLIGDARAMAIQLRHTIQDCLYLAAAVSAGNVRLVTADPKFQQRAREAFPFVELYAAERRQ